MTLSSRASVAALSIVVGVVLGFTPAVAQTAPPQQKPSPTMPPAAEAPKAPVAGQIVMQDATTLLAKDFIGQTVYATDKTKIGSISDLILGKDAKTVEGFVIGVGGFLGIGEKSVALKLDRLQITQTANGGLQLMSDVKKEELANAPAFRSRKDQEAEKQAAERARNQPNQPVRPAPRPGN